MDPKQCSDKACSCEQNCTELEHENAELQAQVVRLEKINKVLRDRVKRGMDAQGDAFALFHAATVLERKVQERTADLEATNRELQEALEKEIVLAQARIKPLMLRSSNLNFWQT